MLTFLRSLDEQTALNSSNESSYTSVSQKDGTTQRDLPNGLLVCLRQAPDQTPI